jgi:hypothetical protein
MATKIYNGLDLQSQKITSLSDPSSATDAANKQYVDNLLLGLRWKAPVKAATTATGTLATAYENGDTVDGVTLATGDRILLKNQSTQSENGIYTVNASGAPTRATDADSTVELNGAAVYITTGTTNADTAYTQTTDSPTVGSSNIVWAQFGGGSLPVGGAGLTLTGSTLDVGAGTGISVDATNVNIDTAVVVRKYATNIGDGSTTAITVTHSLGTRDVTVNIWRVASPYDKIIVDTEATTINALTVTFAVAPASAEYRCVVHA